MTPQTETKIEIVNGPSKWNLILALFEKRWLEFEIKILNSFDPDIIATKKIKTSILRVERRVEKKKQEEEWVIDGSIPKESLFFKATFSTKTRKGWLVPSMKNWKTID